MRTTCIAIAAIAGVGVAISVCVHVLSFISTLGLPGVFANVLQAAAVATFGLSAILAHWNGRNMSLRRAFRPEVQGWSHALWIATLVSSAYDATLLFRTILVVTRGRDAQSHFQLQQRLSSAYWITLFLASFMIWSAAARKSPRKKW